MNHLQQVVFCLWTITFEALVLILLLIYPVHAHIPEHPEWDAWFSSQVTPDDRQFSCCNTSDVHLLSDDQVRIVDGEYEVLTPDGWLRFPNTGQGHPGNTILGAVGNPTGGAVAWYIGGRPYCFSEGTST